MFKKAFLLLLPSFLFLSFINFSCNSLSKAAKTSAITNLTSIKIESLIADEFSENFTRLSTQNDEILLLLSFYDNQNSNSPIHKSYGPYLFDKDNKTSLIEENIPVKEGYCIATLIELDTERAPDQIAQDIYAAYTDITHSTIEKSDNKIKLEVAIGDDDFLDVKYIDLATLQSEQEITFWGIHLFDEYQYRLLIKAF